MKDKFSYGWICGRTSTCSLVRTNDGHIVRANPRSDLKCSTPVWCHITGADTKSKIAIIVASEALPELKEKKDERPKAYINVSALAFSEGEPSSWHAGAVAGYMAAFVVDRMGYTPVLCLEVGFKFDAACAMHGPSAMAMSAVRGWMSDRWQTKIIPAGEEGLSKLVNYCQESSTSIILLPSGVQLPHSELDDRVERVHVERGALCFVNMRRIEPLPLPLFASDVSEVA